ncbi:MAG: selenide, water dikinase SelD, partial [Myxococcaceae bacterium]
EQGVVPAGTRANLEHFAAHVRFPTGLPEPIRWVLADAQTNGGLLAAVPRSALARAERSLARVGVAAAFVGELTAAGRPRIDLE